MEDHLRKTFKPKRTLCSTGKSTTRATRINLIYADDFIVTGRNQRQLIRVKQAVTEFLKPRGLKSSKEKTSRSISEGFDFLGWHFRKYPNGKLLCNMSKQSISKHRKEIKHLTKTIQDPYVLVTQLNRKIRGWMTAVTIYGKSGPT